ncbi:MAG: tRNA (adenosine(37)-N6)-threonylcarbamoyltransferase complex dimerization subunit type 1 TsaB [Terriglobales bacterium]|jgi:tRNA threonylcarbamoyladenosine biosynthesis protein TsaB
MLILAVDTSGKQGSIALAECGVRQSCAVVEVVPLRGGAFSAELVPQIAGLLEKHGRHRRDLAALVVATGPGSFTGLRVGLAAIKALAEVLRKPIAAISLLEAVACSAGTGGRVLAALDAGRGDVYVGDYELEPRLPMNAHMRSERLLSRKEFLSLAKEAEAEGQTLVTPDATLAEAVRAIAIQLEPIDYPDSGVLVGLGWVHLQRGETVRPENLEANYIRHSDAEIFSKPVR